MSEEFKACLELTVREWTLLFNSIGKTCAEYATSREEEKEFDDLEERVLAQLQQQGCGFDLKTWRRNYVIRSS